MSSRAFRTSIATLAAAACVLGLGACGSSGSSKSAASTGTTTAASTGSGSTPAAGADTVIVKNFAFTPKTLDVAKGTKVTWKFEDSAPHNVTVTSGPVMLHSPDFRDGGTYSYTFTTAGTYDYMCTIHPFMTAKVVVK